MQPDLGTTNVLLGIMAAVSVLEALVLIGMAIGGVMIYRRVMTVVADLETRQIAPLREKVDAILVDVKSVTARVNEQAARVDDANANLVPPDGAEVVPRRVCRPRERAADGAWTRYS